MRLARTRKIYQSLVGGFFEQKYVRNDGVVRTIFELGMGSESWGVYRELIWRIVFVRMYLISADNTDIRFWITANSITFSHSP